MVAAVARSGRSLRRPDIKATITGYLHGPVRLWHVYIFAGLLGCVAAFDALAVTLGGSFVGGPFVGWVADIAGPRWALGVGALAGLAAAGVALGYRLKYGASAKPRVV